VSNVFPAKADYVIFVNRLLWQHIQISLICYPIHLKLYEMREIIKKVNAALSNFFSLLLHTLEIIITVITAQKLLRLLTMRFPRVQSIRALEMLATAILRHYKCVE